MKEDPKELFISMNEFAWNLSHKIRKTKISYGWLY